MTKDEQWLLEEKYNGKATPGYETDTNRLARGEPIAYVIGYQLFLGLKIYLDSKPLIPRPETEWWAEELITEMEKSQGEPLTFLDLCAGSGAIGCAVLKNIPSVQVSFGEIDQTHQATILKNIRENNLDESRAHIGIGDLFESFEDTKFDIIAANPPYIPVARVLPRSVAGYEPAAALFAGEDGLGVMRRIARELPKHLTRSGFAWIECDSEYAAAASALFIEQGFSTEIRTDQYAAPRVIVVSFP